MTTFEWMFLIGMTLQETIRAPHKLRQDRLRLNGKTAVNRLDRGEVLFLILTFASAYLLPLLTMFTTWLDFAALYLPDFLGWLGVLFYAAALALLWRAHRDLGSNWSNSVILWEGQRLVTTGIYARLRHPIYTAMWLSYAARAILLENGLAGTADLAVWLPFYLRRVRREEALLLEAFGDAYRDYARRVGGIWPRLRSD
jgi:protein-S-isoprenylcysteine O-methyltransferase Ste14